MKKLIGFILFLSLKIIAFGQGNLNDSLNCSLIIPSYAYQFPDCDLAERFGNNSNIGLSFLYKTKTNWIAGIEGNSLFGENVRETSVLDSITTERGYIIASNGQYANVRLYERGFVASISLAKIIVHPLISHNLNSGLMIKTSLGLLQHKIRIDVINNNAPQLSKEYAKGYDRLSNGLATTGFIGYFYMSNNRLVNFYLGFEYTLSWTQNRRSFNYDLMMKDTTQHKDCLYGIRVGWVLPLYKKQSEGVYYN